MNNHRVLIRLFPLFFFVLYAVSMVMSKTGPSTKPRAGKYGEVDGTVVRSVTGSGGELGMASTSYLHSATAGETVVGLAQGNLHVVVSGFWIPMSDTVGVIPDDSQNLTKDFALHQNFPNPFNPRTTIEYELPDRCQVLVEIYNAVGQCIRRLKPEYQGPGQIRMDWDGQNEVGNAVGSGIYFYRITAWTGDPGKTGSKIAFQKTKKMLFIK